MGNVKQAKELMDNNSVIKSNSVKEMKDTWLYIFLIDHFLFADLA